MFEQSFTVTVKTDEQGHFRSAQAVTSPFSLDIKITARLQSPEGIAIRGTFMLEPGEGADLEPAAFTLGSGETADLGKWRAIEGDDANLATAHGSTEPPTPNTDITVKFTAAPSFF